MLEIELFDHLTAYKLVLILKWNYLQTIHLEIICISIWMCANKWLMLDCYCYIAILETCDHFFKISNLFAHIVCSIWPIDRTLSGATSEYGSSGNEGVLLIPQISKAGDLPSDCLMSYLQHSLGVGSYPSSKMQSMYSTAPADWAEPTMVDMPLNQTKPIITFVLVWCVISHVKM